MTDAPIDLTEQTIDTFAKIVRNGGKVPDGMQFESRKSDGTWHEWDHTVGLSYYANVRLTPIPQPPRFTILTDPIGVLDSQKPGMYAGFLDVASASEVCRRSNANHDSARAWSWTPIAPEMVPLELADVPPGSYFKRAGDSWLAPSDVCRTGVHFYGLDMPFEKLMEEGWQIVRPGQTEWQKCEKVKP